jgi:hypothetical protein
MDAGVKVNATQPPRSSHLNALGPVKITLILLSLGPSFGEYHRRPDIAVCLLAQATKAGEWHVRPRDQGSLAHERWEQLFSHRRRRSVVDVKDRCNFGMPQLDNLRMDDVAPKQDFLSL